MRAALSRDGSDEIPVVICYEDIYIRDHWSELTSCPWWYASETDLSKQVEWRNEVVTNIGQDWYSVPLCPTREERENTVIRTGADGVFRVDKKTKTERELLKPKVGGDCYQPWDKPGGPADISGVDALFDIYALPDPADIACDGRRDLADMLTGGPCAGLCRMRHAGSPLEACVSLFGYNGFMLMLNDGPELIRHAAKRFTETEERRILEAKALGAEVIWIEECFTDMINPEMFSEFNLPYVTRVVDAIRSAGMASVYYYCGDPAGKLEMILSAGADAVSFEESKKGFAIEIADIIDAVRGRCAVFGNLDAINLLPSCSEDELENAISAFIKAGRDNKNRFVMSIGSPVTPGTSAERVRLYCELARRLGS